MFNKLKRAFAITAVCLSAQSAIAADTIINAYTAVLPPYTLGADEAAPGISHELLVEMGKRAGVDIEIVYMPWKRAQATVQNTPNSLLFTATRTAAREELYGWVTLMVAPREVFVTTGAVIESYDAAASSGTIAVLDGTPRQRKLDENGVGDVEVVREANLAARMLNGGRVVGWYTFDQRAAAVFKSEGFDPAQLVFGPEISQSQNWLASSLEFDPAVAEALAQALESIRADGTYDAILAKYTGLAAS